MKVKVTKQFNGVPEGEVYPKLFKEGDIVEKNLAVAALENGWGEPIADAGETPNEVRSREGLPPINQDQSDAPPAVRAKVTKAHVRKGSDGKDEKYAKGLVVEGDLAREFVAAGVAEFVSPADKSVAGAPETK